MKDITYKQLVGTIIIFVYLFLVYRDSSSVNFEIAWQMHLLAGLTAGSLFGFDYLRGIAK